MGAIKTFEDMQSWQAARPLCSNPGKPIDDGRFKSYRLVHRIEGSLGYILDFVAEEL